MSGELITSQELPTVLWTEARQRRTTRASFCIT